MNKGKPIDLYSAFGGLTFLPDRTPATDDSAAKNSFAMLSDYRDGGVFITHYAGCSEWERHSQGDEIVFILEGETTIILLENKQEVRHELIEGEFIVVPEDIWHRFESPNGVKALTVTPLPTDHSAELPNDV